MENTILIWSNDKNINKFSKEIAKELNLKIHTVKYEEDLVGIPYFMLIVDTEKLKDDFLISYNQFAKFKNSGECKILINGKRLKNVPFYIQPLISYTSKIITRELLEKIIKKAMLQKKSVKKDIFKQRINRIIFIHKLLEEKKQIVTKDMCDLFEISDRTLRRDINVLRDVYEKEIYSGNSGYSIY